MVDGIVNGTNLELKVKTYKAEDWIQYLRFKHYISKGYLAQSPRSKNKGQLGKDCSKTIYRIIIWKLGKEKETSK